MFDTAQVGIAANDPGGEHKEVMIIQESSTLLGYPPAIIGSTLWKHTKTYGKSLFPLLCNR